MKRCTTCEEKKSNEEFPSKGLRCNACGAAATRAWYDAQTPEIKKATRKRQNDWHQNKMRTDAAYREKHLTRRRKRYSAAPEIYSAKEAKRGAVRRLTNIGRARQLVAGARVRDKNCTIELIDVLPIIEVGVCPRTGFKFDLSPHTEHHRNPFSPSMDRIDGTKGYVKGNIQIVCSWYNIAKNEYSDAQMLEFCQAAVDTNR
jgi:hypothetical protein